ncbi:MAG: response regulator transcription factor [Lachnospiraceae bacterium]|nr:response regulator transcription factor [Lachnospiraceae bacterium]
MFVMESNILLVDDEEILIVMVSELLQKAGYRNIDRATNIAQAEKLFEEKKYQLVLLDVMLPDGDGFSLLEKWRKEDPEMEIPVIFLSARDEDQARLKGLGLGADDYITKPFLTEELLLRIQAVLRRTYRIKEENMVIKIGEATVDFDEGIVKNQTGSQELTAKEFLLLRKLCDNRGKIVSMNALMDTLWPDGSFGYENSLMVHIRRLREKIEQDPSNPEYLVTIRGLGYKLKL